MAVKQESAVKDEALKLRDPLSNDFWSLRVQQKTSSTAMDFR